MKLTKAQREQLKNKFGGHCAYCGCDLGDKWHADHIEAVKRDIIHVGGGKLVSGEMTRPHLDTIENMNPACVPCNLNKSSMSIEGWRGVLGGYRKALIRDSHTFRHSLRFGLVAFTDKPVMFFFETYQQGTHEAILEAQRNG
jgi:hypothetical protein